MKILVCLDGSQYAKGVIDPAARLAEESHSEVHLLSVVDLSQVHERPRGFVAAAHGRAVDLSGGIVPSAEGRSGDSSGRDEPDLVEDRDQALTRAREEALDALRLEAHHFPSPVYVDVMDSDCAATAITAYARSHGIDVIAMATRSRGAVGKALFGSTTSAVVDAKVAPVLVVHR